jgi:hypothetical protein
MQTLLILVVNWLVLTVGLAILLPAYTRRWRMYGKSIREIRATFETQTGIYDIPGPPPTGRHLESLPTGIVFFRNHGGDFVVIHDPVVERNKLDGREFSWSEIVDAWGPLRLIPLTEYEKKQAEIYGPPSARWGNPDETCSYLDQHNRIPCALGVGHIGLHRDLSGAALAFQRFYIDTASAEPKDLPRLTPGMAHARARRPICNCGRLANHAQDCPVLPANREAPE